MAPSRALLILDLDETLVFATENPLSRPADFQVAFYHVYRRPFLDHFLSAVREWFDLAVWTSSSPAYALAVVGHLFPEPGALRFAWDSDRCTLCYDGETRDYFRLKNLKKVKRAGYPLERVLVVDDTPSKLARHYGNLIPINSFEGDESDTTLRDLLPFLHWIQSQANVRRIEKRGWRTFRGDVRGSDMDNVAFG